MSELKRYPWSKEEFRDSVRSYFDMYYLELRGEKYVKAAHRKLLLTKLNHKSAGSAEFMYQNISAVLDELGMPFIKGYLPRDRFAKGVRENVFEFLEAEKSILAKAHDLISPLMIAEPAILNFEAALVAAPEPKLRELILRKFEPVIRNFSEIEARNVKLGFLGEKWAVELERERLINLRRKDLASKVMHVSLEMGDGAGYDISSFEVDERPRLIEVKTTNYSVHRPFFISENERAFSDSHRKEFCLYRVFDFKRNPKLYVLQGYVGDHLELTPTMYQAST